MTDDLPSGPAPTTWYHRPARQQMGLNIGVALLLVLPPVAFATAIAGSFLESLSCLYDCSPDVHDRVNLHLGIYLALAASTVPFTVATCTWLVVRDRRRRRLGRLEAGA